MDWPQLVSVAAALPCLVTAFWRAPPLLIWNVSASAPTGLYRILPRALLRRGDMVIARLPNSVAALAASRHYLPLGVPIVKGIAAVPGDTVCARGDAIRINGTKAALRHLLDARGRTLPRWNGCRRLQNSQYLLLNNHAWSFDGRYFGLTTKSEIIGRASFLWAR